jgi:hypothetical protein
MRSRLAQLALVVATLVLAVALAPHASAQAPSAPAFVSWAPLGDYERAAFAEQGALRIVIPTKRRDVEIAFTPQPLLDDEYGAERVDRSGVRTGGAPPAFTAYTGHVEHNSGRDFAKLGVSKERGALEGLLRIDGAFYAVGADLAGGDFVIGVREVDGDEVAALAKSCGVTSAELTLPETGASAPLTSDASTADGSAPGIAAAGALREIELGTEADAPFVSQAGGAAAANSRILSIVNMVNGIYETDLGLTNRVVVQRTHTGSDPYTTTDAGDLLDQFRFQYLSNVATVYDGAMLFSGRDFAGSTVGVAFVGSTCTPYRFGVAQFLSQHDPTTALIVAHEEGHNLGALHTSDGIMAPSITGAAYFSQASKDEIGWYVDSVGCLALTAQGAGNQAPTLVPIGPQLATEGQTLEIQLSATDLDGDPLTYGATPLPPGASLSGDGLFRYTPVRAAAGCNATALANVQFTASDGLASASETVPISVVDVNTGAAPLLSDPADRTLYASQLVQFQLQATDADGDSIRFSSPNLPAGATLSSSGAFSWAPTSAQVVDVTLQATDCTGRSAAPQSVQISVTPQPAPHLVSLSSTTGWIRDGITLTGTALMGKKVIVRFAGKRAKITSRSDTEITLVVPSVKKKLRLSGFLPVTLTRDRVSADNTLSFDYVKP